MRLMERWAYIRAVLSVAIAAGIWTASTFVPAFASDESLAYSGSGEGVDSWSASTTTTICAENGGGCDAMGGTLTGGPFEFCVGDGVADNVSGITLTGNAGDSTQWIITDGQGVILGLPPMPGVVDFDGAGGGSCFIWHLSYYGDITGLEADLNANDLQGCFELSNSIEVVRVTEGALCVTSTADFGSVSALEIYPNPAGDFVQVAYEGLETTRGMLQLVDLTGSVLQEQSLRQNNDNIRLDISGISGGYYFIRIDNGAQTTSEKLVILK